VLTDYRWSGGLRRAWQRGFRYHARKARYLGKRKALLQAAWSAVLVNLHPIGTALRAQAA
jgi:hypothetical protein